MAPRDPSGPGDAFADHHAARGWLAELFEEMWHLGKPTVARVQGWAMAGGLRTRARLRPGGRLRPGPLRCSRARRRALALHGDRPHAPVDAAEEGPGADDDQPRRGRGERRSGSASSTVSCPTTRLDEEVAELAAVLASKPPGVMRLGRESFYAVLDSAATEALPYLHAMLTVTSQTAEAAEGIAAFMEKRPRPGGYRWATGRGEPPVPAGTPSRRAPGTSVSSEEQSAWRSGH